MLGDSNSNTIANQSNTSKSAIKSNKAPRSSKKAKKNIALTGRYVLMTVLAVVFLFPMVWMIVSSTKSEAEIYGQLGSFKTFLPNFSNITGWFDNYKSLLGQYGIWKYMVNSIFYASIISVGNVAMSAMAGYAIAKYDFPGKKLIFGLVIGLVIVPIETTIIPLYTIAHKLGITGTILAVIIPPLISVYNIFLFRQFFIGLPKEVEEAAMIDGASRFKIFTSVILPMSKPIVATVGTLGFIGAWNDYVWPIMVLPAPTGDSWPLYPIQAALNTIQQIPTVTMGEIMAALTLTTIPLIIIYILAQNYIVEGFTNSGIK